MWNSFTSNHFDSETGKQNKIPFSFKNVNQLISHPEVQAWLDMDDFIKFEKSNGTLLAITRDDFYVIGSLKELIPFNLPIGKPNMSDDQQIIEPKQEPKQVLIWRSDVRNTEGHKVRTGKICAQLAHASMKAILDIGTIVKTHPQEDNQMLMIDVTPDFRPALHQWLNGRFTKVAVCVNSEQELLDIYQKAKDAGLLCSLIQDAGLTEFGGVKTYTAVAIGPAYPIEVDPITSHLKTL